MKALLTLFLFLFAPVALQASEPLIELPHAGEDPIGRYVQYLQEDATALDLAGARQAYTKGRFNDSKNAFLSFGIGSPPVWLRFEVHNPAASPIHQRLTLETSWLDRIEVYILNANGIEARYQAGDTRPFEQRPIESRFFRFDHAFSPGTTTVFIRTETPDPMVLPVYLGNPDEAGNNQLLENYSYGFLYGGIFVLLAYNLMIFFSLRSTRYLYYSLYLAAFLLMNLAYTGHGFMWLWPDSPRWQQWSNPLLMMLFAVSGLLFATQFLETRFSFPRLHRLIIGSLVVLVGLQAFAVLADNQVFSLLLSFFFIFVFSISMVLLGALSLFTGNKAAKYFLIASVTHATAASITALVVWGIIPYSPLAYRAVDIGMLLDAILLALALADQFRINREATLRAEKLAHTDPLTELNNRRAFYEFVDPLWSTCLRHRHDVAVILLDIDRFKIINDTHGHKAGDRVLIDIARAISKEKRTGDILARWGGEEFILFLPETTLEEARIIAERLRQKIAQLDSKANGNAISLTASLGVAHMDNPDLNLDELICLADKQLYCAKEKGRNRVC